MTLSFYKKFILKHNNYMLTHMIHLILFSYLLVHDFLLPSIDFYYLILILITFICLDVGGLLALILTISLFFFNIQAHSIGSDGVSHFLPEVEGTKSITMQCGYGVCLLFVKLGFHTPSFLIRSLNSF